MGSSEPGWARKIAVERRLLEAGGVPKTGENSGWILMLSNNLAKALQAFMDGKDGDGQKFLYRLAALATIWSDLLQEGKDHDR